MTDNYEKLVEKVAEWLYWYYTHLKGRGDTWNECPPSLRELYLVDAKKLLTAIFTPAQIEALKQGGEIAVTDIEQKPPSPGWAEWPMYQEIAEKTQERILEANFRKVVTT